MFSVELTTYICCMILSLMGSTGKHLKWKELYYAFLMWFHYWVSHKMTTHNCHVGKACYLYAYHKNMLRTTCIPQLQGRKG